MTSLAAQRGEVTAKQGVRDKGADEESWAARASSFPSPPPNPWP